VATGSYGLWGAEHILPAQRRKKLLTVAALALLGGIVAAFMLPTILPAGAGSTGARVSDLVYPASLVQSIDEPVDETWTMPAAAAAVGDVMFVLDTGNNRIVKLGPDGHVLATFGPQLDAGTALQMPMAIVTDGRSLFIANSSAGNILVVDLSGQVERILPLPGGVSGKAARPIGVALLPDGGLVASDADNDLVLRLDAQGNVIWIAGTGTRDGGSVGFNVPSALATDAAGDVYVTDILNARVVELSPAGEFTREFGKRGDTAGFLSRPKGVAVDAEGRVFVSDGLLAAVEVFAKDGSYLGLIGRRDPRDVNSTTLFTAPAGLSMTQGSLIVTDRYAGVLTFDLTGTRPAIVPPVRTPIPLPQTPQPEATHVHTA
jgi:DNA-binding beta-propeller fold protein YncE